MGVCKSRAVAANLLLPLLGVISYHQRMVLGGGR
jgi:hypothetical protein